MSDIPDKYRILFQDIIHLLERIQNDKEFLQRFVKDPASTAKSTFSSFQDIPTEQLAKVFEDHKRRMDKEFESTDNRLQVPMASILDFLSGIMERAFSEAITGGSHSVRISNSPPE